MTRYATLFTIGVLLGLTCRVAYAAYVDLPIKARIIGHEEAVEACAANDPLSVGWENPVTFEEVCQRIAERYEMGTRKTVPVGAYNDEMYSTEWGCDELDDDCQHLTAAPLKPEDIEPASGEETTVSNPLDCPVGSVCKVLSGE